VLCAAAGCESAFAQTPQVDKAHMVEEVVVTAQRREENILDVPIAIQVVTAQAIEEHGLEDVQRLADEVPSLIVSGQSQTGGGLNLFIRGIGSSVGEPAVGFYIDEIYVPTSSGFTAQFIDTERVEVLKGPQGTLWGRNTTGGALHYITRKPGDKFEIKAQAEAGFYDSLDTADVPIRKLGASVNIPLGDSWAVRVSGSKVEEANYTFNLERDKPEPNQDATAARVALRFHPREDFEVLANFDYLDDPHHNSFLFKNLPFAGSGAAYIEQLITDIGPEADTFRVRSDVKPIADYNERGGRLKASWSINDTWQVNSISGYRELTYDRLADLDVTQAPMLANGSQEDSKWYSQELQLFRKGTRSTLTTGAYYYSEDRESHTQTTTNSAMLYLALCNSANSTIILPGGTCGLINNTLMTRVRSIKAGSPLVLADFLTGGAWDTAVNQIFPLPSQAATRAAFLSRDGIVRTLGDRYNSTDSVALYSHWNFQLNDQWSVTAGARWTQDQKDDAANTWVLTTAPRPVRVDQTYTKVTPKVGVEWRPRPRMMTYASVTNGYKAGTVDSSANVALGQDPRVSPESVWAYEVGLKADWFDRKFQVEAAAFYYDYSDYQLSVQFAEGPKTINLDGVRVKGLEFSPVFQPNWRTRVGVAATYIDSEVNEFNRLVIDPFDRLSLPQSLVGRPLPRAPELKLNAFASYMWPLLGGSYYLTTGATAQYTSKYFNDPFGTFPSPSVKFYNAQVRLAPSAKNWSANVYVRNITNEEYVTSTFFADQIGEVRFFAPPRTIGVQLGVSFE
jgi:iron complex outermembrane receptor protein